MTPTLLSPRSAQLPDDLSALTDAELHNLVATEHRRHNPPWIYFLCALWFILMFYFAISNMLPPRRRLSHHLRIPDRFFRWAPGKAKFDLEWKVKEDIRKREEEQRRRVFAEQVTAFPPQVKDGVMGKGKGKPQVEDVELRMLTPMERGL
jgi:hypothetical protein